MSAVNYYGETSATPPGIDLVSYRHMAMGEKEKAD